MPFFIALEAEIVKAELAGKSVIIEMDSNSKLGPEYIKGDPNKISPNGKILAIINETHALFVANGSPRSVGLITRTRNTTDRNERSCIDVVLFSSDLNDYFKSLIIDDERKHVLTKVTKSKKGVMIKESDHNVLITEFTCETNISKKKEKVEIYNLKNLECQKRFKELTSKTKMLSTIFNAKDNINVLTNRFIKKMDGCIKMSFKKVRVNTNKKSEQEKLHDIARNLKGKEDNASKEKLEKTLEAIAEVAEKKYQMLVKELKKMNPEKGKIDSQRFWKMKKKVFPKSKDLPSAMLDKFSNLLTTQESIEARALEVYGESLQPNAIKEHLKSLEENINKLCDLRLNLLKSIESDPWTLDDLKRAVKDLDRDKSRDALGHANELFKEEVAGTDLKLATLRLMNHIKKNHEYPEVLNPCNITSIYKQKGSHTDFENYRGVFRVTVLRSILDRLIYNDNYHTIDDNLTDGNVGARKQRNIRDNIFVLGAVTNSVLNGGESPIQVQV